MTTYIARSASDHTDNWPYWYICTTESGLNITTDLLPCLRGYMPFISKDAAIALADSLNNRKPE